MIFSFSGSRATIINRNQNEGKRVGRSSPVLTKVVVRRGITPNQFHPILKNHKPATSKVTEKMDNLNSALFEFQKDQSGEDLGNLNLENSNKFDSFGSGSYNQ